MFSAAFWGLSFLAMATAKAEGPQVHSDPNGVVTGTYPSALRPAGDGPPALTKPTARPVGKPKVVPAMLIARDKISVGDDPHLSAEVKTLHPCENLTGSYKVCVAPDGKISSVTVAQGIPGADEQIMTSLKSWVYRPQPIPLCFIQFLEFQILGDTKCLSNNEYHPLPKEQVSAVPLFDAEKCAAAMSRKWANSQSYERNDTGRVELRLELDDHGKIHKVGIIKSQGLELDVLVVDFLRHHPSCRMTPAIDKAGKPAAFVIERYATNFER